MAPLQPPNLSHPPLVHSPSLSHNPAEETAGFPYCIWRRSWGSQRASAFPVAPQEMSEPRFELLTKFTAHFMTVSTAFCLNVVIEGKLLCNNLTPTPPLPKTSPIFFLRDLLRPFHLVTPWVLYCIVTS